MRKLFFAAAFMGLAAAANAADRAAQVTSPEVAASTGTDAKGYGFSARLVDPEANARRQQAEVQVGVTNFDIADPALTNGQNRPGQGHIHYQLDGGPEIETTSTKIGFHKLSPGSHQIGVSLVSNNHELIAEQTLAVTVPAARLEGGM